MRLLTLGGGHLASLFPASTDRAFRSRRGRLRRLILGGLFIVGSLLRAEAQLVHFLGQDRTHIWCIYTSPGGPLHALALGVTRPDGSEKTLAASPSRTLEFKGVDAGLEPGLHAYWLRVQANNGGPWESLSGVNATVDGKTVGGTLLFDEVISKDATVATQLIVPEGIQLTLGSVRLTTGGGRLEVRGKLLNGPGTRFELLVEMWARNDLRDFTGGTFWFHPGAEGSLIEGGRDFTASFPYTDFQLAGCSNAVVTVQKQFMNLSGAGFQNVELKLVGQDATLSGLTNVVIDATGLTGTLEVSRALLKGLGGGGRVITRLDGVVVETTTALYTPVDANRSTFNGHVTVEGSAFEATDCKFASLWVNNAPADKVKIRGGWFSDGVRIAGGAPQFEGCEFGGSVALVNRSGTKIRFSHFLEALNFLNEDGAELGPRWFDRKSGAGEWPEPVIELNSFMGQWALQYSIWEPVPEAGSIPIGPNYYGDPSGWYMGYAASSAGFLGAVTNAGAAVPNALPFKLQPATPAPAVVARQDTRVFPRFWLQGWIAGQNTIGQGGGGPTGGPLMRGRETLLSVDVRTTEERLENVRVYAVFDGAIIEAERRGPLQRNPTVAGGKSAERVWRGMDTFNFVLPPNEKARVPLAVFLDATRVTGFDPAVTPLVPERLLETTIAWNLDPPKRDLVFAVAPVFLRGLVWNSAVPNVQQVVRYLQDDLPGMVPCPASRIQIRQTPPVGVRAALGPVSTLDFTAMVAATLQALVKISDGLAWASEETPVDFVVAVVPAGSLHTLFGYGAFEGARYRWAGRVLIVDEGKPEATIHELGHGLGLYTSTEQYDDTPPNGQPIEGVTSFITEVSAPGKFSRVKHFPGRWYSWYFETGYFDVMSAASAVWTSPQFIAAFSGYMGLGPPASVGASAAPQADDAVRPESASPDPLAAAVKRGAAVAASSSRAERIALASVAPGSRRILLEGQTRRVAPDVNQEEFIGGSLAAFEVTSFFKGVLPPSTAYVNQSGYQLRGLDASGTPVTTQGFYLPSQSDGTWMATFDVPAAVTEYAIVRVHDEQVFLRIVGAGTLSNRIVTPTAGGTLGSTLDLRWTASGTAASAGTVLRHWLFFSADGGRTWLPSGLPQPGTRFEAASDFLPRTTQLLVRLFSSDGVTSVQTEAGGIVVANRAPVVQILEPRPGDAQTPGSDWTLRATVADPDGDAPGIGQWESSISGVLGSGAGLDGIQLSPGRQVLSYTVTDAGGARGRAEVNVTVESGATVDLGLAEDALRPARLDPAGGMTPRLRTGATNTLNLTLRGPAVGTRCRVRVAVRSPGREPVWFHESREVLFPARDHVVPITCFIPVTGQHEFTVVLDEVNPPDRDPANNTSAWTIASTSPIVSVNKPVVRLAYTLGPNDTFPPEYSMNLPGFILLYNAGDYTLEVGSPVITGDDAGMFTASPPSVSGGVVRINLNYHATAVGLREAHLRLTTNDPDRPVVDVLLRGYVYFITDPQYADDDRDGILNLVEARMGTDPKKADTDGDGLPDVMEDRNQDGVVDPGESDPRKVDTDGDGLMDGDEDANRDGIRQANETDPSRWDTDGDGISDGGEVRAKTDPTVVLDHLDVWWAAVGPRHVLQWLGREGVRYRIERSPDLVQWSVAPSGAGVRNRADQTAGEDGVLEYEDPEGGGGQGWFYRASVP